VLACGFQADVEHLAVGADPLALGLDQEEAHGPADRGLRRNRALDEHARPARLWQRWGLGIVRLMRIVKRARGAIPDVEEDEDYTPEADPQRVSPEFLGRVRTARAREAQGALDDWYRSIDPDH
jgi:hypothetical protein